MHLGSDYSISKIQFIVMLNNACIAYFENQLERFGVDLISVKPNYERNGRNFYDSLFYPDLSDDPAIKAIQTENLPIEIGDTKLRDIDLFMNKKCLRSLKKAAIRFTRLYRKFPNHEIIFIRLEPWGPFISESSFDPETDICMRTTLGSSFGSIEQFLRIDFSYVIIKRCIEITIE